MNKARTQFITDLLGYILVLMAVYCALIGILVFTDSGDSVLWQSGIVLAVPFLQYMFKYIRSAVIFMACHIILLVVCTAIIINGTFSILSSLVYSILWLSLFLMFLHSRRSDEVHGITGTSAGPIVCMLIFFAISASRASAHFNTVISLVIIVAIIIYFINMYIVNSYVFYEGNIVTGVMNFKKSMNFSTRLMAAFTLICTAIMGLSVFLPSMGIVSGIEHLFYLISKWFIGLFTTNHTKPAQTATLEPTISTVKYDESDAVPTAMTKQLIHINYDRYLKIIGIILLIIIVAAVIFGMFAGLKKLEKKNDEDERYFVSPFEDDGKIKSSDNRNKKKESFLKRVLSRNPNMRIRRAFAKTISVNTNIGERIKDSYTPTQLCEITTVNEHKAELDELKKLYEQARYSDIVCSKADAARAEQLKKII